MDPANFLLKTI